MTIVSFSKIGEKFYWIIDSRIYEQFRNFTSYDYGVKLSARKRDCFGVVLNN